MNFSSQKFWLGEMFVEKWDSPNLENGLLYFHGFPGSHVNNSNVQLADSLGPSLLEINLSVLAPQYTGLGSSKGTFSFLHSFSDANRALEEIQPNTRKIDVLGYSWGGLVGAHAYTRIPPQQRGKLVLLAPVTQMFSRDLLKFIVSAWRKEYGDKLTAYNDDDALINELVNIFSMHNPLAYLKDCHPNDIRVIHGDLDEVIPILCSEKFVKDLGLPMSNFNILKGQGHEFLDRSRLLMEIRRALQDLP